MARYLMLPSLIGIPPIYISFRSTIDGDPLTYNVASNPSHGTLSGTPANLTYTPNAGFSGADSFTFAANDGKADSNIATVSIVVTLPTGNTITVPVTQGSDDAGINPGSCIYQLDSNQIDFGHCPDGRALTGGFRFQNIQIPPGATINEAHLEFIVDGPYNNPITIKFFVQRSADATTFTTADRPDNRTLTTASVPWAISDPWIWQQSRNSPNLAAIIQEIINLPGWASGNALAMIVQADPTVSDMTSRRVYAWEREKNSSHTAHLVVNYTPNQTSVVSGKVIDTGNNPISGATISDGAGHTATTDASGNYTLPGLAAGTYTLTSSKSGYTFSPSSIPVTVPPDAANMNFTGTQLQMCGPMDVAFVVDTTTSMGDALNHVKGELTQILGNIEIASSNDYRLALVNFGDDVNNVNIRENFAPNNRASVASKFQALSVSGGGQNEPEPSDEALNTVVNALPTAGRSQNVDFTPTFRAQALKIIILVTDARPGGFHNSYTPGIDDVNAHTRAVQAVAQQMKISAIFVPTNFSPPDHPTVRSIMQDYATTSNGVFIETTADGSGTGAAINDIIARCGTAPNRPPVANGQNVTTAQNTPINVTLTASDADGDLLTYSVTKNPDHGTLSGAAPNLTYTPATGFNGSDSFTFKVTDGKAESNATASITVTTPQPGMLCGQAKWATASIGGFMLPVFIPFDTTPIARWDPPSFVPDAYYQIKDYQVDQLNPTFESVEYHTVHYKITSWSSYQRINGKSDCNQGTTYTISGQVVDALEKPIADVTMASGKR